MKGGPGWWTKALPINSTTWAPIKGIRLRKEIIFLLKRAIKKINPARISKLPIRLKLDKKESYFTGKLS